MSISQYLIPAIVMVFGSASAETGMADDKPPTPDEAAIKAVLGHFEKHGVKLQKGKDYWWVVTDPKGEGYEVIVAFRSFPAKAGEQEMRNELKKSNLYFMLNVPARVAMSKPGLRAGDIEKMPTLKMVPVAAKLEKLFNEYRPPE